LITAGCSGSLTTRSGAPGSHSSTLAFKCRRARPRACSSELQTRARYPLCKSFRRNILAGYLHFSPNAIIDLGEKRISRGIYPDATPSLSMTCDHAANRLLELSPLEEIFYGNPGARETLGTRRSRGRKPRNSNVLKILPVTTIRTIDLGGKKISDRLFSRFCAEQSVFFEEQIQRQTPTDSQYGKSGATLGMGPAPET
jgi:hypothetical protein